MGGLSYLSEELRGWRKCGVDAGRMALGSERH